MMEKESTTGSQYVVNGLAVAAGQYHSVVLLGRSLVSPEYTDDDFIKENYVVVACGSSGHGQLGFPMEYGFDTSIEYQDGRVHDEAGIYPVLDYVTDESDNKVDNIIAIAAGKYHTVLLKSADAEAADPITAENASGSFKGTHVIAFGDNRYGQLGRNIDTTYVYNGDTYPMEFVYNAIEYNGNVRYVQDATGTDIPYVSHISAAGNNTVLVDMTGNVYVAGSNSNGQLGNGNNTNIKYASKVQKYNLNTLTASAGNDDIFIADGLGYVHAAGKNSIGQLGDLSVVDKNLDVLVGSGPESYLDFKVTVNGTEIDRPNVINIEKGETISLDKVYGMDLSGFTLKVVYPEPLNAAGVSYFTSDNEVASLSGTTVTGAGRGTAVIKATATVTAEDGSTHAATGMFVVNVNEPDDRATNPYTTYKFYTEPMVSSGVDFSVALKSDGSVWAWGKNDHGQLGNGEKGKEIDQWLIPKEF